MRFVPLVVDDQILDKLTWASFVPSLDAVFPRMYRIDDGSSRVFLSRNMYMWIDVTTTAGLLAIEKPPEIQPAPNVQYSEGFILKALAIAQDPKLAKDLI